MRLLETALTALLILILRLQEMTYLIAEFLLMIPVATIAIQTIMVLGITARSRQSKQTMKLFSTQISRRPQLPTTSYGTIVRKRTWFLVVDKLLQQDFGCASHFLMIKPRSSRRGMAYCDGWPFPIWQGSSIYDAGTITLLEREREIRRPIAVKLQELHFKKFWTAESLV